MNLKISASNRSESNGRKCPGFRPLVRGQETVVAWQPRRLAPNGGRQFLWTRDKGLAA